MNQQTIVVLGTNAGQADLIRHMKERGWRVVACAHVTGLPGEMLADQFEQVDIRNDDAVADLARRTGAELIYSISSDVAIAAATRVSKKLGLPHFYDGDLINLLDRKHALRGHLNDHGLSPVAYAQTVDGKLADAWSVYPCIVKPADAQGQRAVMRIDDSGALADALADAVAMSPSGTAIVEQFLDGVEVSSNVLVQGGRLVVNEVSERLVHTGAHFGIPIGHLVPPVNVTPAMQAAARNLVQAVVASLGIQDGCLYFQMKITSDGPRIIEIAPRLDGCHMWRAIAAARNFDFLAATIDVLTGKPVSGLGHQRPAALTELMFQQTPPGSVFSTADFPVPNDALYHEYRYTDGQTVAPINGLLEVVGYYVRQVGRATHLAKAAGGTR